MLDNRLSGKVTAVGLCKWYYPTSQPPVHVLQDCSFDIEPGRLTVLMGISWMRQEHACLHIGRAPTTGCGNVDHR